MNKYDMYISLIFAIKIAFIIMTVSHIYMKATSKMNTDLDKKIVYWKDRLEFIFIALMSILLIYVFNPRRDRTAMIDGETKLLFYLFGFVLMITGKWGDFIHETKWLSYIQQSVGK